MLRQVFAKVNKALAFFNIDMAIMSGVSVVTIPVKWLYLGWLSPQDHGT